MRALVSAGGVVAVCRSHADRVHDLARRLGCTPTEAAEVTETAMLDLIDALAGSPETVRDLVGGLYARARRLALQVRSEPAPAPAEGETGAARDGGTPDGGAPDGGTPDGGAPDGGAQDGGAPDGGGAVPAALDRLGERARAALLLRDSYRLLPAQAAVGLEVAEADLPALLAEARLGLLRALGQDPSPADPTHPATLADLGGLADGTLSVAGRAPQLRRHLNSCAGCAAVLDAQTRARTLVGALTPLGLDDAEREPVLRRVAARAQALLPDDAALAQLRAGEDDRPLVSPVVVGVAVALALVLGAVTGALLAHTGTSGRSASPPVVASTGPSPSASASTSASPSPSASASTSASPSVSPSGTVATSPAASTSPSASPSAGASLPAGPASITLQPASGPNGTTLTVLGTGWRPGRQVVLDYLNPLGQPTGATASAVPDSAGRFVTHIVAEDRSNLPGPHRVVASNGTQQASATYQATP